MTDTIIAGTLTGAIMLLLGTVVARFSLKTKTQETTVKLSDRVDDINSQLTRHIRDSEMRNEVVLESLLAIMLAIKGENCEAKIDVALAGLNNYIINKGAR